MQPHYRDLSQVDSKSANAFISQIEKAGWEWGNPVDAYRFSSRTHRWKRIMGPTVFEPLLETRHAICVRLLGESMGEDTKRNEYRLLLKNQLQYKVTPSLLHIVQKRPNSWEERLYIKQEILQPKLDLSDFVIPENLFETFL